MPGTGVGFGLDRVRSDDSGPGRSYWWTTGEAMKLANGFTLVALGLLMAGCVQSTLEPASEAGMKPRDKELLAKAPYERVALPEMYRRHVVDFHRKEAPGSIVVDTDARYLYLVLARARVIRRSTRGSPSRSAATAKSGCFDFNNGAALGRRRFALESPRSAEIDPHDLRRNAEADRHVAAAKAARHDHVPVLLDDVAIG